MTANTVGEANGAYECSMQKAGSLTSTIAGAAAELASRPLVLSAEIGSRKLTVLLAVVGIASVLLAGILFVPLWPVMPSAGLDASWAYAINVALAQGYVFGDDLIFTFGPLASLYTGLFSPQTDTLMITGSVIYAAGFCAAFYLAAKPHRHVYGIAALVASLLAVYRDANFLTLPFFLLLVIVRATLPDDHEHKLPFSWQVVAGITLATVSVALSPLVKGTFSATSFLICTCAFVVFLIRKRFFASGGFLLLIISTVCIAWTAAGQPLSALPHFFVAESPIISGYTEAMSLGGKFLAPISYVAVALVLLWVAYAKFAKDLSSVGWLLLLGLAVELIISFKAGFVRQDQHALIAGGALLLLGCAVMLVVPPRVGISMAAAFLCVWGVIVQSSFDGALSYVARNIVEDVRTIAPGLLSRIEQPGVFGAMYDDANRAIMRATPLPKISGSVDIYPTDLSAIFGNGLKWSGRPVFQSYSAYTPDLLLANASHLLRDGAPRTVFLKFSPIDNRPPSFDDSRSLLVLLSRYKVVGYSGSYIRFDRAGGKENARLLDAEAHSSIASWSENVAVGSDGPTWAVIDIRPSLIGKIIGALFKRPQLEIDFTLEDETLIRHRFIPGIGRAGFIVSPYLASESDFVRLAAGQRPAYQVKSIRLVSNSPIFWNGKISVRFIPISIIPQTEARPLVISEPSPATLPINETAAQCSVDLLNNRLYRGETVRKANDGTLQVQGWAAPPSGGDASLRTWVAVTFENGKTQYFRTLPQNRPDVAAALNRPGLKESGFNITLDLSAHPGKFLVKLLPVAGGEAYQCPAKIEID